MQVEAAEYEATLINGVEAEQLQERIGRVLASPELPRVRREKPYDLRPLIEELRLMEAGHEGGTTAIFMRLSAREAATGRPEEVLDELGISAKDTRVERTRLILQK